MGVLAAKSLMQNLGGSGGGVAAAMFAKAGVQTLALIRWMGEVGWRGGVTVTRIQGRR